MTAESAWPKQYHNSQVFTLSDEKWWQHIRLLEYMVIKDIHYRKYIQKIWYCWTKKKKVSDTVSVNTISLVPNVNYKIWSFSCQQILMQLCILYRVNNVTVSE